MKKKFYLIAMFIVFGMAINAQYKAKDDFESYAEGDINTLGNTANGWVSSWGVLKGDFKVIAGTPTGKALKASGIIKSDDGNVTFNYSDATAFRDLDSLYPGNAKNGVYWVGFNITFNSFITSDDIKNGAAGNTTYWPTNGWAGLSLYKGDKELLFMGKPGDNNDGVGMGPKSPYSDPAKLSYWVVVRIENRWADSLRDYLDPKVCLWLDPIERGVMDSNEPDTAQADQVAAKAELRGGFNRIRIASASEFSLTYDNIRVGRSFAAVNYQTVMTEPTLPDLIIQNKIIGSALPPKAFDTFDSYTEGATLADLGDANTNGWLKAWEADGSGFAVADLNIDSTAGKHVEMAGYTGVNKNFRTFAKKFENAADRSYWVGFEFQYILNPDQIITGSNWAGVSLFNNNDELLFMGHPNGSSSLGLDGNGIHTFIANYDTKAWIVGRIDMHGEADADANPDVYFWIDPPKDAEPDVLGAEITTSWPSLKSGFNRIRLGGDSNGGIMLVDNFVMGNKFSDLYTYKPDTGTLVKKAVSEQKTLIRASQGMIEILDVAGKNVAVYSIEGHKLYSNKSNTSNLRVNLKQGIYIVLVNNFSQKVVVVE